MKPHDSASNGVKWTLLIATREALAGRSLTARDMALDGAVGGASISLTSLLMYCPVESGIDKLLSRGLPPLAMSRLAMGNLQGPLPRNPGPNPGATYQLKEIDYL